MQLLSHTPYQDNYPIFDVKPATTNRWNIFIKIGFALMIDHLYTEQQVKLKFC